MRFQYGGGAVQQLETAAVPHETFAVHITPSSSDPPAVTKGAIFAVGKVTPPAGLWKADQSAQG